MTTTYYAITDDAGAPTSIRIEATSAAAVPGLAEDTYRDGLADAEDAYWTDAEDDLDICLDSASAEEVIDRMEAAGYERVAHGLGWGVWAPAE